MAYVCLTADNKVITIFGSEQNLPTPPGYFVSADDSVPQIGGTWNGVAFVAPPTPVPTSVSRFQAMAALSSAGLLAPAQAAVTTAGGLAQLAWDNAQAFERSSPTIAALAATLNLTSAQVDALFIAAAQIQA